MYTHTYVKYDITWGNVLSRREIKCGHIEGLCMTDNTGSGLDD
jgi:hypothetical protein